MVGQLLKVLGLDFPLDNESKMAYSPQMKKGVQGFKAQGPESRWGGRGWVEAEK